MMLKYKSYQWQIKFVFCIILDFINIILAFLIIDGTVLSRIALPKPTLYAQVYGESYQFTCTCRLTCTCKSNVTFSIFCVHYAIEPR